MFLACWLVKSLVPRGWCHKWREYVYFTKNNFLRLLIILTFRKICGYLQSLYRITNLSKPQPSVCGNRCWSSFGCFSFSFKEISVAKRQFVLLEICDPLSAKPGLFSINRALVNGYFIVKCHCYIYRLLDSHSKRFYCFNLNIWISQILFELINFNYRFVILKPSSFLCSLLIIHGQT